MAFFRFLPRRETLPAIAVIFGLVAVACGSSVASPAVVPNSSAVPVATTGAASPQVPTPNPYVPDEAMYRIFPGFGLTSENTFKAFEEVEKQNDISQVPVIIESMRYQSSARAREAAALTLQALTGQGFGGEQWDEWMEWYGANSESYPPPEGYLDWKIAFMSQLDTRFAQFLRPAKRGEIDVDPTELVWGGVLPDGIPDLRNPRHTAPEEATYLAPDERVFGLSINGESRAYPLRITNPHEMVNDTLGGEPFALSW